MAETTIEWELKEAIPLIEKTLEAEPTAVHFRDASYVKCHARTKLNPTGPRWCEQAPVISRLLTLLDHLIEIRV